MRTCLFETNDHLFGISENQLESLNPKGKNPKKIGLDNSKKKERKIQKKEQPNFGLRFEHLKKLFAGIEVPLVIDCSLMLYLLLPSELPVQG